jgi:hypothetical protein
MQVGSIPTSPTYYRGMAEQLDARDVIMGFEKIPNSDLSTW